MVDWGRDVNEVFETKKNRMYMFDRDKWYCIRDVSRLNGNGYNPKMVRDVIHPPGDDYSTS